MSDQALQEEQRGCGEDVLLLEQATFPRAKFTINLRHILDAVVAPESGFVCWKRAIGSHCLTLEVGNVSPPLILVSEGACSIKKVISNKQLRMRTGRRSVNWGVEQSVSQILQT